jgi:hypothetical protein
MATLDFPSSPSVNDTYSFGNKTWVFNGQGWQLVSTSAINGIVIGNANAASGNFTTVGATGNITTDQYFIGNGAFLTGISSGSSYSNANVKSYLGNFDGNIIPSANITYDLGSNSNRWNDLYLNNSTIYIGAQEITANASTTVFSGNIAANYLFGNASFLSGVSNYSNANVAAYLPNYQGLISNVDFRSTSPAAVALVVIDRPLTMGGNSLSYVTLPDDGNANSVAAELTNHGLGNVLISAGPADYEWIFDHTGNLTLPGSTFAVNYANGQQVSLSGTYSNSNVAAYLASNAAVTILTTGNITTSGNIQSGNVIPLANAVYDLGSLSQQWRSLYVSNNTIYISNVALGVTTSGALTVNNVPVVTSLNGNIAGNALTGNTLAISGTANLGPTQVNGNLTVAGNITASGNVTYINVQDLVIDDPLIFLGATNPADTEDLGIVAAFTSANIPQRTGFARDYTDSTWKVFTGVTSEPNTVIAWNEAVMAPFKAGSILSNATITANANVTAVGNVSGTYLLGNGAFITGLPAGYSNSDVANYLASNAAVTILTTGNITTAANIVAGNITTTGSANIAGNLTAGNLLGTGSNTTVAAGSYSWVFDNAGNLTLAGNTFAVNYANGSQISLGTSYSNSNAAAYLASNSAVTILTTSNITTAANITGNYILGNGSLLTGIITSVSNINNGTSNIRIDSSGGNILANVGGTANVVIISNAGINVAGYVSASGNVSGGNITTTGMVSATGNITSSGNISAGNITATGNLTAGNLLGSGSNTTVAAGSYNWVFDDTGNLTLSGNTFAVNYANGQQISLGGSYSNSIVANYLASNAAVTILTTGNITSAANVTANYLLGNGYFISGIQYSNIAGSYSNANVANYLPTYTGNVGAGNFVGSGDNVTISAGVYTWTFNNLGNLSAPGNLTATGNITGNYILGNGSLLTGIITSVSNINNGNSNIRIDTSGGNILANVGGTANAVIISNAGINVAGYVTAVGNITTSGNVTANNVITTGNVTSGNFVGSGANVNIGAGVYTWNFNDTGNLVLPANTFAVNYANGTPVTFSGTYSNANVAAYLPTYNGNALFSNITVSRDVLVLGNLRVEGNTTEINVSNLFVEDKDIIVAANANATLSDLNGAGLQIGNRSAGGNITFFYDSIGNVMSLSHGANIANVLNVAGNIAATGNLTAGNFLGSGSNTTIAADNQSWVFDSTGNLTLAGNTFAVNYANGQQISLGGTYSNSNAAAYLASNAAVTILTTGNITTSANISGNYLLGNGAFITGLPASYSNSNVSAYLASNAAVTILTTGNITTTANVSAGNIATSGSATVSGNLTAGNFLGSGSNTTIAADNQSWVFDSTGNLTAPGNITASGNITANYLLGNGYFISGIQYANITGAYGNANVAAYLPTYNGNALFGNVTVSQNAVILGNLRVEGNTTYINVTDLIIEDKDIIVAANANATMTDLNGAGLQIGNRSAGGNITFFYDSTSNVMSLSHGANIANVLNVAGNITATGNTTSGNVNLTGNIVDTGALSIITGAAGNITLAPNGTSILIATTTGVNIAGYLNTTGNISAGNVIGSGTNVEVAAGSYNWIFDNTGNLTLAGNTFAVNYANGQQISLGGSYSNSNVAAYLASNAAVTILTTANITTSANIAGNYFIGNGALLTGVVTSSYSNANVANYLPTYTGNVSAGNLNLTGNIVDTGALTIITGAAGNITLAPNSTSVLTVTTTGVNVSGTFNATGNISAGNLIGSGNNVEVTAGSYNWVFDNTGNVTLAGNTFSVNYANGQQVSLSGTYSNSNVAAYLASNAAVTVLTTGNITTAGNVTANYLLGNGYFVTGIQYANITGAYSNTNVLNYLQSGATINANFGGGNITTTGTANLGITQVNGNLTVAGNIIASGNVTYINVQDLVIDDPLIFLGATNPADTEDLGIVAAFTSGNVPQSTGFARDYTDSTWKVFTGVTSAPNTVIAWNEAVMAPFKAGPMLSNASITANANVTAVGNVSGSYLLGNGYFISGIQYSNISGAYSNSQVAAYLQVYNGNASFGNISVSANVTAGNMSVANGNITVGNLVGAGTNVEIVSGAYTWTFDGAGNLTGNGNISAGNFVGTSGNTSIVTGPYTWVFNDGGNLVLPGNGFSVNYANGQQVSLGGSYSNAVVANYLASNAAVTILTTGNITTTANIAGNYFIGNGALLTGVVTSSYSNANVANYLPTYTGNVGAGNLNLTGNIVDTGAIFVITGANGNIVLAPNGTSRVIATTSGANVIGNLDVAGNVNANGATLTGNITAGNLSVANGNITLGNLVGSGTNVEIVSGNYTWTFDGAGNLTGNGNISAGNFVGSAGNTSIVTGPYTWVFNDGGNLVLPGNGFSVNYANGAQVSLSGTYSNSNVASYLASNAAVTILTTGNITTAANIAGNYILGNGAFITGLPAGYSNADVANYLGSNSAVTILTTSNITTNGNLQASYVLPLSNATTDLGSPALQWRSLYVSNNTIYIGGVSVGVSGNSLTVDGNTVVTEGTILTGNINTSGNITGGNLITSGTIIGGAANVTSLDAFSGGSGGSIKVKRGDGVTTVELDGSGTVTASANITAGGFSTTGNLTAAYLLGNGAFITGLPAGYANSDVANYLASGSLTSNITTTGNISAGNVSVTGVLSVTNDTSTFKDVSIQGQVLNNLTVQGNVNGSNLYISQDAVILGNLRVTGNTTEINVSNIFLSDKDIIVAANANATLSDLNGAGLQIGNISAGGNITFFYNSISNSMVLSHGANIANTVGVTGNIDASGNISGLYLLGNGSQLTGISAGAVIADDTTTNSNYYPVFATATSGSLTTATISSTKLTFNPGSGTLTAVDVNTSSDAKFKENVQQIASAVDTINSIQGVSFNWKETGQRSYGIIAQELAEVLPELVHSAERGLTVSYLPLIAILIEAIKEQQQQIDQLKNTKPS